MKIRISVSEEKYDLVKEYLARHEVEVGEDGEYVLTEASKYPAFLIVRDDKKERMRLSVDEVIYVEMKSTKTPVEYHTLEEGDTYRYIAQKYGIQLKLIIKRNSGAISSYGIGDKICLGCK